MLSRSRAIKYGSSIKCEGHKDKGYRGAGQQKNSDLQLVQDRGQLLEDFKQYGHGRDLEP